MGKNYELNILVVLLSVFLLAFVFSGAAVISSGGNFTVSPDSLYLNWTGYQINITSNQSGYNDTIYWIHNKTTQTTIKPQYFDDSDYSANDYDDFTPANYTLCLGNGMPFLVKNSTGAFLNRTNPLNNTDSTYYNLTAYLGCPPGYYTGVFNVSENGTSDYANITVYVNIPVSSQNTYNDTTGIAYVRGNVTADTSVIHKYYFNTSIAENNTGITINLTGHTEDIDLYLFDSSGTLLDRSVENGTAKEEIYRALPATPDMWEIWIWGNTTATNDYQANMYFTTFNLTNTSNDNQEFTSLDFGTLDVDTSTSSEINVTLKNAKEHNWTNVKERAEIYTVKTWKDGNTTGDYYFVVPYFAQKIKAKMEWKGGTKWFISLNDSNSNFRGNSSGKYETGNITNTVQEENIIYTSSITTSNEGLWKLTVGNLTNITDNKYNITVYLWYNYTTLLNSTYPSTGFNFTDLGTENATKNITLKINIPTTNISNGTYSGYIEYYKPSQWDYRIPVSFNVMAGNLLVNNTFSSTTDTFKNVVGFERSGANVLQLALPINNTGGYDISFVNTTSNLTLSLDATHNMSFVVGWPSNPLSAGSGDTFYVNVTINTSKTSDTAGLYTGWIRFNTTNSSQPNASSYPYKSFDVNVRVNLTNKLVMNISASKPSFIRQVENASNITMNISVRLQNGTNQYISKDDILKHTDFYSFDLIDINTSYSTGTTLTNFIPRGGGAWTIACPASGSNPDSICKLNATIPAGLPGGRYYIRGNSRINTSVMAGTGINLTSGIEISSNIITINDTGLKLTSKVSDLIDVDEGSSFYYTLNIVNYGPLAATSTNKASISFNNPNSCSITIAPVTTNSTCSDKTSSGTTWSFSIGAYANCSLSWRVTADSDAGSDDCNTNLGVRTSHGNYGNLTVLVSTNDVTTGDDTSSGGDDTTTTDTGCSADSECADSQACVNGACSAISCPSGYVKDHTCYSYSNEFSITNYNETIEVVQGGSATTKATVKNNGAYTRITKFTATPSIEGITAEVSPETYNLAAGNSGIFTVDITTTEDVEVGYHKVTLKAYVSTNDSIYTTKDISFIISPREETKIMINQTYDQLKALFASTASLFNQITPTTDGNYTLANRTYARILNMLTEAGDKLKAGQYVDAYSILKEANTSITDFQKQINKITGMTPFVIDFWGMLAIIAVVIVIGVFLVYLLLPPKKGYHPVFGYQPKKRFGLPKKSGGLSKITEKFKSIKITKKKQHSLGDYTSSMPFQKEKPSPLPKPEKKSYTEGYKKESEFPFTFKKDGFKEKKKKFFGK